MKPIELQFLIIVPLIQTVLHSSQQVQGLQCYKCESWRMEPNLGGISQIDEDCENGVPSSSNQLITCDESDPDKMAYCSTLYAKGNVKWGSSTLTFFIRNCFHVYIGNVYYEGQGKVDNFSYYGDEVSIDDDYYEEGEHVEEGECIPAYMALENPDNVFSVNMSPDILKELRKNDSDAQACFCNWSECNKEYGVENHAKVHLVSCSLLIGILIATVNNLLSN